MSENGEKVEDSGTPTAEDSQGVDTASSPEADEGALRAELMDVVNSAIRQDAEPSELSPTQQAEAEDPDVLKLDEAQPETVQQAEPAEEETEGESEEVELTDDVPADEIDTYRPKVKKRVNQLLAQRAELRQQVASSEPYLKTLQNGVSKQDADLALGLVHMLAKGDFQGFMEGVTPYLAVAQQATGQALPDDLAKAVQEGYTTQEVASELAANRMQKQFLESQVKLKDQQQKEIAQQQARTAIAQSVTDWENTVRQTDPDYAKKEAHVQKFATAIMHERGMPESPAQAVEWAKEAYEQVSSLMAPPPTLKESRPSPSGVGQPSVAQSEPNSLMEAAMQGLRNAHKG